MYLPISKIIKCVRITSPNTAWLVLVCLYLCIVCFVCLVFHSHSILLLSFSLIYFYSISLSLSLSLFLSFSHLILSPRQDCPKRSNIPPSFIVTQDITSLLGLVYMQMEVPVALRLRFLTTEKKIEGATHKVFLMYLFI